MAKVPKTTHPLLLRPFPLPTLSYHSVDSTRVIYAHVRGHAGPAGVLWIPSGRWSPRVDRYPTCTCYHRQDHLIANTILGKNPQTNLIPATREVSPLDNDKLRVSRPVPFLATNFSESDDASVDRPQEDFLRVTPLNEFLQFYVRKVDDACRQDSCERTTGLRCNCSGFQTSRFCSKDGDSADHQLVPVAGF